MAKISFVSLGCDKNLVDSEVMIGLLKEKGHVITDDEHEAEIIVVNTCCFIEDALEESINTIIEIGTLKQHKLKAIIAVGCLSERYKEEIFKELPEIDVIIGATSYEMIVEAVDGFLSNNGKNMYFNDKNNAADENASLKRELSITGSYYAYLKIAEGCDMHCTYCVIPSLKGKYRSRTMESLVKEAEALAEKGAKEIIIIAQDTSRYGVDLYGKVMLAPLLNAITQIDGVNWVRLMYCYPENISAELIDEISKNEKIVKYIDLPIQHISDKILRLMGRKTTAENIKSIINELREKIDGMVIRTSLITGFPGETEDDFNELLDFVKEYKLERVGVFPFSREKGTKAYNLPERVNKKMRIKRKNDILKVQKKIAEKFAESFVNETLTVIVEGKITEADVYMCRGYMDAPMVDAYVFVEKEEELLSGEFIQTNIVGCKGYDLWGV